MKRKKKLTPEQKKKKLLKKQRRQEKKLMIQIQQEDLMNQHKQYVDDIKKQMDEVGDDEMIYHILTLIEVKVFQNKVY